MPQDTGQGLFQFTLYQVSKSALSSVLPHIDHRKPLQVCFLLMVSLIALGGFFYQTSSFLALYLQYPSTTDMTFSYPDKIPFPSLHVCNHNSMRRTKLCEMEEDSCFLSQRGKEICEHDPQLCQNTSFISQYMIPRLDKLDIERAPNLGVLERFSHGPSMIRDCFASWAPDDDFCSAERLEYQVIHDVFELRKACYIVNSQILKPPTNISHMPTYSVSESAHYLSLVVDLEPFEYFQPNREVAAYFEILSPVGSTNPYRAGVALRPGKLYRFKIKAFVTNLLKAPYKANCKDYNAERRSYEDPVDQNNCVQKCIFELSTRICSCVPIQVFMPTEPSFDRAMEFCPLESLFSGDCTVELNISKCYSICPKECNSLTYEYKIIEEEYPDPPPLTRINDPLFNVSSVGISIEEASEYLFRLEEEKETEAYYTNIFSDDQFLKIIVELEKPELAIYTQNPKYESIALFSYIGGYLGMWLGMCVIMSWDAIEILALLFAFPFARRANVR